MELTQNIEINIREYIAMDIGGVTLKDHVIILVQVDKGEVIGIRLHKTIATNDGHSRFCKTNKIRVIFQVNTL